MAQTTRCEKMEFNHNKVTRRKTISTRNKRRYFSVSKYQSLKNNWYYRNYFQFFLTKETKV
jgi:hypothetical protein